MRSRMRAAIELERALARALAADAAAHAVAAAAALAQPRREVAQAARSRPAGAPRGSSRGDGRSRGSRRAIEDVGAGRLLEVALLGRRQIVIDEHDLRRRRRSASARPSSVSRVVRLVVGARPRARRSPRRSASRAASSSPACSYAGTSPVPPVQLGELLELALAEHDARRELRAALRRRGRSDRGRASSRAARARRSTTASSSSVTPGSCTATTTAGGRSPSGISNMGRGPYSISISSANPSASSAKRRERLGVQHVAGAGDDSRAARGGAQNHPPLPVLSLSDRRQVRVTTSAIAHVSARETWIRRRRASRAQVR